MPSISRARALAYATVALLVLVVGARFLERGEAAPAGGSNTVAMKPRTPSPGRWSCTSSVRSRAPGCTARRGQQGRRRHPQGRRRDVQGRARPRQSRVSRRRRAAGARAEEGRGGGGRLGFGRAGRGGPAGSPELGDARAARLAARRRAGHGAGDPRLPHRARRVPIRRRSSTPFRGSGRRGSSA